MIDDQTFGGILAFLTILSGSCAGIALIRRCRDKSERARWSVFHRSRDPSVLVSSQQKVDRKLPLRISDASSLVPTTISPEGTASTARRVSIAQKANWSNENDTPKSIPGTPTEQPTTSSQQLTQHLNSLVSRISLVGANTDHEADVFEATVSKIDLSMPPTTLHYEERQYLDVQEIEDANEPPSIKTSKTPEYHKSDSPLPTIKEDQSSESEPGEVPRKTPSLPEKKKRNND